MKIVDNNNMNNLAMYRESQMEIWRKWYIQVLHYFL